MKRKVVFVGIVLLIIAIVAVVCSLWQIPFQEQEAYVVPQSSVVLQETIVVPSGGETVRPLNLNIWDQLHIFLSGSGGYGNYGDVNFLILDETNYLKREAGESFDTHLFLYSVSRYNQYDLITHDGTWYFIWDNSLDQFSEREVYTTITRNWNETAYRDITVYHEIVPSAYSTPVQYGGTTLIAASAVIIFWGIASKKEETQ